MTNLDLRGLNCPLPVLKTKSELDKSEVKSIIAIVDDAVSVNNLKRLAGSLKAGFNAVQLADQSFQVTIDKESKHNHIEDKNAQEENFQKATVSTVKSQTNVIFLAKDHFGEGDPELSKHLLEMYLQTIFQSNHEIQAVLLANSGVKLMAAKSSTRKILDEFKARGTDVLVCGLCADFYGIKNDLEVEQITNMYTICEYLFSSSKVLSP